MSETAESETGLDALASLVRESSVSGVERRALLLRVDALPPSLSRPHHLRLARNALDPLALADRGRRHELPNGRVAVSWRGESPALLRKTMAALDTLLQDAPHEAPGVPELVGLYDLPGDGAALLRDAGADLPTPVQPDPPLLRLLDEVEPSPPRPPLDTRALERLEHRLVGTDVARFARRRPVSRLAPAGMRLAWEERFLSVSELIEAVAPGCDPKADLWLFRRLTRALDRRMLSILSDPREVRDAGPFSITLNVASLLGAEFLRFDGALPSALRGRVVIGLLPADVASDAGAFVFARNFARARGYKFSLRAVSAELLPILDLAALDLDFVQLVPSPALLQCRLPEPARSRWVLGRPCDGEAIEWGKREGVGLFATRPD